MNHLRHVQVYPKERIESRKVLTRMGELGIRNMDTLVGSLYAHGQGIDATVVSGLSVEPLWGMNVSVSSPGVVIQSVPLDSGRFSVTKEFSDITIDDADPALDRIDIIEAQVVNRDAYLDHAVPFIDPVTQAYITESKYRDMETYLEVRKKTGVPGSSCPITTQATGGEITGSIAISGTIDLSQRYILAVAVGIDAEFVEVNCAGAVPSMTTLAEIVSNLNNAGFGSIASIDGNYLKLEAPGTGENSLIRIKQPRIADTDAISIILGEAESPGYVHSYQGQNKWFKIAEVSVPAGVTALDLSHISTIDEQASWTEESGSIAHLDPYEVFYNNTVSNLNILNDHMNHMSAAVDYTVNSESDFYDLFERSAPNVYRIKTGINSVYIRAGIYSIATLIAAYGDSACYIQTNQCRSIQCEYGTFINYAHIEGYFECNTAGSVYTHIQIYGDDATSLSTTQTFLVSASSDVVLYNCGTSSRRGACSGYTISSSQRHTIKFINCNAYHMGTHGFLNCDNLIQCYATHCQDGFNTCRSMTNCQALYNSSVGYRNCNLLSSSNALGNYLGYYGCWNISACLSQQNNNDGFNACYDISGSCSWQNAASQFAYCGRVSGCTADGGGVGQYGYYLCSYVDPSCYAISTTSAQFVTPSGYAHETCASGCMGSNGELFFDKFLSGSITNGQQAGTIYHNIYNAISDHRILTHSVYIDNGSLYTGVSYDGSITQGIPHYSFIGNTAVIVFRTVLTNTYTWYTYIRYK